VSVVVVGATVVGVADVLVAPLVGGADDAACLLSPPPEHAASTVARATAATATNGRRRACWAAMDTVVWAIVLLAVVVGLFWLASRIEPHWSSSDGTHFTCRVQEIDLTGRPTTRWYEARCEVVEGGVAITKKLLMRKGETVDPRPVSARSDDAPRGKAIYLLPGTPTYAVRVPSSSQAARRMDALMAR